MSNEISVRTEAPVSFSFQEIERMGVAVAKSGLFGVKTPEQAVALLLLAQAEGLHPMAAARDYHIMDIKGVVRPCLKAETMLARFQANGGKVEWLEYSEKKVSGKFTHPSGGQLTVEWTWERAQKIELTSKDIWKKYPAAMLRSRVISEAIRTINPGVLSGLYTPDEAESIVTVDAVPVAPEPFQTPKPKAEERKSERKSEKKPEAAPSTVEATPPAADRITPEEVAALKQKWNQVASKVTKETQTEGARYLRERFGFVNFEDIRPDQLLEVMAAMSDIKEPGK